MARQAAFAASPDASRARAVSRSAASSPATCAPHTEMTFGKLLGKPSGAKSQIHPQAGNSRVSNSNIWRD